jgi:hypothetical protein
MCGRLLDWECPDGVSYTETECCGLRYKLQPWTIKVHVEDVSSRPILPKMEGSDYADPDLALTFQFENNEAGRKCRDGVSNKMPNHDPNLDSVGDRNADPIDTPPTPS